MIRESLISDPPSKARVCLSCLVTRVWCSRSMDVGGHDPGTEPPSVDPKTGASHRIGNSPQTIGKVDMMIGMDMESEIEDAWFVQKESLEWNEQPLLGLLSLSQVFRDSNK